jgi:hypothetical protein
MSRPRAIGVLVAFGIAILLLGSRSDDGTYVQALLVNVGTGIVLFALLYLVQQKVLDVVRASEHETKESVEQVRAQVAEVRDKLDETETRLDELGAAARKAAEADVAAMLEAIDSIGETVSMDGSSIHVGFGSESPARDTV